MPRAIHSADCAAYPGTPDTYPVVDCACRFLAAPSGKRGGLCSGYGGAAVFSALSVIFLLMALLLPSAFAQQREPRDPPPHAHDAHDAHDHGAGGHTVKILFVPPPMEGTLSLGIYNSRGALVRVLHQEAETDEFTLAFNGLVTSWDGKDDHGNLCPPGEYRAKGYMVGDLRVEGVDFHGNDWFLDDESPRISRILRIAGQEDGTLLLEALQPGSNVPALFIATAPDNSSAPTGEDESSGWKLKPLPEGAGTAFPGAPWSDSEAATRRFATLEGVESPGAATFGPEESLWGIDGKVIKEFIGETLERTLYPIEEELAPTRISATPDLLFVLGESATEQRLRGLPYSSPGEAWVEMGTAFSNSLEQAAPVLLLPGGEPFEAKKSIKTRLITNPLLHGNRDRVDLRIDATPQGTLLSTVNGLPLTLISETPHLMWAAMSDQPKRGGGYTVFESDGAVIAEFRIREPERMMAFDAGVYQWEGTEGTPGPDTDPEVSPSPSPSPAAEKQEGTEGTEAIEAAPAQPTEPSSEAPQPLQLPLPAEEASPTPAPSAVAPPIQPPPETTPEAVEPVEPVEAGNP